MREAGAPHGAGGTLPSGFVIAIDGPVGAGKSTVARRLAEVLGCVHIDSGAMYRALGWKALRVGVAATDVRIVTGERGARVLVDGEDVTHALRTPAMDEASSVVSTCPAVRERMVALQRAMAREGAVVMDGRDIGTVVFPNAQLKFFLDADVAVRADRRLTDLRRAGATVEAGRIREEVERRDARDRAREVAPLRAAPDAIRIDSTSLEAEAVVRAMLAEVAKVLNQDKS
ncbi:MAG: cmk [candidate division NC10 bacterium]|nr:cmk [candidate division NC10 bacterium]